MLQRKVCFKFRKMNCALSSDQRGVVALRPVKRFETVLTETPLVYYRYQTLDEKHTLLGLVEVFCVVV